MSFVRIDNKIRHLHDKLTPRILRLTEQMLQDGQIHSCTQVIDVGHEHVLFPFVDELL